MWFGACTSSIGTWMQIVAQGWLVYRLSHSAFLLALDQFLGGIPIFLFSLIGGVVADRVERRKILLGSQYVQMTTAGLLTILVATGRVHVWHILCLSFISGFAQAFGGPAYQALIPTLVDREDMPNAIALNSIQFNVAAVSYTHLDVYKRQPDGNEADDRRDYKKTFHSLTPRLRRQ